MMLDALERIEIHIRSVVAHEVGQGKSKQTGTGFLIPDPLAWRDSDYIDPKYLKSKPGFDSTWDVWQKKHSQLIDRNREDCIKWHKVTGKDMPFWVVIEAWDFGTLSKYFGMLNDTYKQRVCLRLGISNKAEARILAGWLKSMNSLRNNCAHHTRIWNQQFGSIVFPSEPHFHNINLDKQCSNRIFGLIVVIWFLLKQIGPSSNWLNEVKALIKQFPNLPGCELKALGIPINGIEHLK